MNRRNLTNHQWEVLKDMIPGKAGDPGRSGNDNRLFLDAVLWMARTGAPWRDLPGSFGLWNTVWKRFSRWSKLAYPVNADTHYMLGAPNRRSRVQRRSAPQPRPRSPAMI